MATRLPVFDTNPNDLDELTIPDLFKLKKNLYVVTLEIRT